MPGNLKLVNNERQNGKYLSKVEPSGCLRLFGQAIFIFRPYTCAIENRKTTGQGEKLWMKKT